LGFADTTVTERRDRTMRGEAIVRYMDGLGVLSTERIED
jgi:hypothetical protein